MTQLSCPAIRKPFDVLAEGLVSTDSRGDRRLTFLNDFMGMRLFHATMALAQPFTAEQLQAFGRQSVP